LLIEKELKQIVSIRLSSGQWAEDTPDLVACARNDLSIPDRLNDDLPGGSEAETWN
jgi:hypothetical protein